MACQPWSSLLTSGGRQNHVISVDVQPVLVRSRIGKDLQGHRPLQSCIALAAYGEEVVRPEIHHNEPVSLDKANTVGPWFQRLPVDVEGHLSDEVGLIFLLDAGRVS